MLARIWLQLLRGQCHNGQAHGGNAQKQQHQQPLLFASLGRVSVLDPAHALGLAIAGEDMGEKGMPIKTVNVMISPILLRICMDRLSCFCCRYRVVSIITQEGMVCDIRFTCSMDRYSQKGAGCLFK